MSVLRSPTNSSGISTSQPDLSSFGVSDHDSKNISIRKRKTPDDDFSQQLKEFRNEIYGMFQNFGKFQTENFNEIKQDITTMKEQLNAIKTTQDRLIAENVNLNTKIDGLTTTINNHQEKIMSLESDIHDLKSSVNVPSTSVENLTSATISDEIITELQERTERGKNIIVIGISEQRVDNIDKKGEADKKEVNNIISAIYPACPEPEKIIRLGKYNENKARPIKVCFTSQETAQNILKKRTEINDNNIKIYSDRTPYQQKVMFKLREELQRRTENGEENLTIKYQKGVPKIIKQQSKN